MAIHTPADECHRARIERSEVGQPAPKDRVDLLREVIQGQSGASLQPPGHCLAADIGQLLRGHGRQEPREVLLPFLVVSLQLPQYRQAVGKGWNTKRRHAQPGRADTLLTDARGRAVVFGSGEPSGLTSTLPGVLT